MNTNSIQMPNVNVLQKYLQILEEIKKRLFKIQSVLHEGSLASWYDTESLSLQFRIIIELILFSTIAPVERHYIADNPTDKRRGAHWQFQSMLKYLNSVNPNFYPRPVFKADNGNHYEKYNLEYLTKEKCEELYTACHKYIHPKNPWISSEDRSLEVIDFSHYYTLTVRLMTTHSIVFIENNSSYVYIAEMGSDAHHPRIISGYGSGPAFVSSDYY